MPYQRESEGGRSSPGRVFMPGMSAWLLMVFQVIGEPVDGGAFGALACLIYLTKEVCRRRHGGKVHLAFAAPFNVEIAKAENATDDALFHAGALYGFQRHLVDIGGDEAGLLDEAAVGHGKLGRDAVQGPAQSVIRKGLA